MIGLNRVKDFLLLIIIMKASEILTNFQWQEASQPFLWTWKWQDYKDALTLSTFFYIFFFFDNALPLLFPREKWL